MRLDKLIQELHIKKAEAMTGGGQARIDAEHSKGKLTARNLSISLKNMATCQSKKIS